MGMWEHSHFILGTIFVKVVDLECWTLELILDTISNRLSLTSTPIFSRRSLDLKSLPSERRTITEVTSVATYDLC